MKKIKILSFILLNLQLSLIGAPAFFDQFKMQFSTQSGFEEKFITPTVIVPTGGYSVKPFKAVIVTNENILLDPIIFNPNTVITGAIVAFGIQQKDKVPAGWLACDGTSYLRADKAKLFAVIGTTWGIGEDTVNNTTFSVPDLKNEFFLRGNDLGAGRDPDATVRKSKPDFSGANSSGIGTYQNADVANHDHGAPSPALSSITLSMATSNINHSHSVSGLFSIVNPSNDSDASLGSNGQYNYSNDNPAIQLTTDLHTISNHIHTNSVPSAFDYEDDGTTSKPKSARIYYFIKD